MLGGGIPLFGRAPVQVIETQPVSIHGDVYFDCVVRILKEEDLEAMAQAAEKDLDDPNEPDAPEEEDEDSVQIGEWRVRQPSYRLRLPQHICEREPAPGDVLDILFIAQQPSEVDFLTE